MWHFFIFCVSLSISIMLCILVIIQPLCIVSGLCVYFGDNSATVYC